MNKVDMLTIAEVSRSDIPVKAEEVFRMHGALHTMDADVSLRQFDHFYQIEGMGVISYVAEHEKLLAVGEVERSTYIYDTTINSGDAVGFGEMRLGISDTSAYFKDKPFVGYTKTFHRENGEDYRRHGYGMRRLYALNLAARTLYNLSLHSDTNRSDAATRLWQKLVDNRRAEQYKEGQHKRFKFIDEH